MAVTNKTIIAMAATTKQAAKNTKTKEGQYCHQSAAELFRWSDSLYFCNGVRIRYGDHEYYVRLMAAKAMMQRQKTTACIDANAKFIDGSPSLEYDQSFQDNRSGMDQGSKS